VIAFNIGADASTSSARTIMAVWVSASTS